MKSIKTISKIFFPILVVMIIVGVAFKLDYDHSLRTLNSDDSTKVSIQIDEGETVDQILATLVDNGVLQKKWTNYFKIYIRVNDLTSQLQAGAYDIPKNLNIVQLTQTLKSGTNETWILIKEGLRKDEIADVLVDNFGDTFSKQKFLDLTTDQDFIKTLGLNSDVKDLEGYLFPDSYSFDKDSTEQQVIERLVDNFKDKVGTSDTYQTIILASIVEKEGRETQDREIEAGIILKRYEEGWTLGLDTTLMYYYKTWVESDIEGHLTDNNPYNTRVVTGFPPTPISNPGLDSINAARNPITTDYYYFYSCGEEMKYSVTYDEHIAKQHACTANN